jgi:tetratricopeptide (TPR) repeat protein
VINVLSVEYLLPPFLLIALIAAVFYSWKWTRGIIFGSLFFLVTILPVLKLIPVGDTFAADRYMYIPSIGLFYIAGVVFNRVYVRNMVYQKSVRITLILLLCVIVFSFSVLTYLRNDVWQDGETLWLDVVEKYPHSTIAHNNLSSVYEEMGLLEKAISEAKTALKLDPDNPFSHYGLGIIYTQKGMVDDAIVEYNKALRIKPDFVQVRNNLGLIYREKGLFDEAIAEYKEALMIAPQSYHIINNLGVAYLEKGLLDEAVSEFRKALAINHDYASAHNNLGSAYVYKGLFNRAVDEFKSSLVINPNDEETHFNLGLIYMAIQMPGKALKEFQETLRINPDNQLAKERIDALQRKGPVDTN